MDEILLAPANGEDTGDAGGGPGNGGEDTGDAGGGPGDDLRYPARTQGFIALSFGFALGVTFMLFFLLFKVFGSPISGLEETLDKIHPNLWFSFIYGFVGGTFLSAIYNCLVVRYLRLYRI